MKALFKKELRENLSKLIIETVLLSAISATLIPLGLKVLLKMEKEVPAIVSKYGVLLEKLKDVNFFVRSQWFGKNLFEFVILFAVINGIGLIAGEYERKTAVYLFSKPVSRRGIFGAKIIVAVFYTIVPVIISTLLIIPFVKGIPQALNMQMFFKLLIEALFASAFTVSIAAFVSVIVNDRVKGGFIVISLIVADIVLSNLARWHYLDYSFLFVGNFVRAIAVSSLGAVLFIVLSVQFLDKKEF